MTEQGELASATNRRVVVLPRIRLKGSYIGEESFSVSKADFLPDEQSSWEEILKLPRPEWLDIFREFPGNAGDEARPCRGTLVVSEDDEWLQAHIGPLVAMVYVMGIERKSWQVPADAFRYSSFQATQSPQPLVRLHTKTGGKTEDLSSLQLFPPLELRAVDRSFQVELRADRHVELIKRFDANPYDRLTTACYHLFRSQFEDQFMAPSGHDAAAYCACLEAALDLQGPDYAKNLATELQALYGEHTDFARWIKGLYSERSVFNHGVSIEPDRNSTDDREVAQAEFRDRSLSWDILRHLCLDVIGEQLQNSLEADQKELSRLFCPVRKRLRQFFDSTEIWAGIAKVFTQSKSVDRIQALAGQDHDEFIELCCSFLNGHIWEAMKGKVPSGTVCKALMTMAAIIGECARVNKNQDDIDSASDLFNAAKEGDGNRIREWARHHSAWQKEFAVTNTEEAARAVAVHTAMFFR